MGLAERRAIRNFQDEKYPAIKQQIDAAACFDVPMDINWDTLAEREYAHLYDEALPKVYFQPLIDAFKAIAIDDMGKEALKSGLKKVSILNSGNTQMDFENGILIFDHSSVSNIDYGDDRKKRLQKVLEDGL